MNAIILTIISLLTGAAQAQTPPAKILGIDASGYGSYDPDVAIAAGLPAQTGQGGHCLKTTGTTLAWGACAADAAGLSDRDPQPLGVAAPGTGTNASRDDHVHLLPPGIATNTAALAAVRQVPVDGSSSAGDVLTRESGGGYSWAAPTGGGGGASLSDRTPQALGTAAAGTGTRASRDDHVHLLPAQIATNRTDIASARAQGTTNRDNIQTNAAAINANKGNVTTNATAITTLQGVQNPALASSTAGHLVRQKSDHSAYETVGAHDVLLAGLPAITGQATKVLTVNSAASGVEWKAPAGGSGDGGGAISVTMLHACQTGSRGTIGDLARWECAQVANADSIAAQVAGKAGFLHFAADVSAITGIAGDNRAQTTVYAEFTADGFLALAAPAAGFGSGTGPGRWAFFMSDYGNSANPASLDLWYQTAQSDNRSKYYLAVFFLELSGGGGGGGDTPTIPDPSAAGANQFLRVNAAGAAYELAPVVQGHPFAVPGDLQAVKTGSNIGGTSARVARADHAHAIQSALYGSPVAIGTANAAGSATTLARSDHVHSQASGVATRDQVDSVAGDVEDLRALTQDIILGTPPPRSWADVANNGTEGGITSANRTWTLDLAKAATYTAPRIATAVGSVVARIPAGGDPRNWRLVVEDVGSSTLNTDRVLGSDNDWQYYLLGYLDGEAVKLQTSTHAVSITTWDGKLGPNAAASLVDHNALLWTATNTATQWASGNVLLGDGVAAHIYDAMRSRDTYRFTRLEMEIHYAHTVNGAKRISKALIPFPLQRRGGIDNSSGTLLSGVGRLGNATLHAAISMPSESNALSDSSHMTIGGCSWCQGAENIEIHLYGVN